MKVILVDAINTFVIKDQGVNMEMQTLLDSYNNKKIILTNANDEQIKKFGLDKLPYEVFTLKHNPDKSDFSYYKKMLDYFNLNIDDVVYFEHNIEAVKSARNVGINTYHYNEKDLTGLRNFLDKNL